MRKWQITIEISLVDGCEDSKLFVNNIFNNMKVPYKQIRHFDIIEAKEILEGVEKQKKEKKPKKVKEN